MIKTLSISEFKSKVGIDAFEVVGAGENNKTFVTTAVGSFKCQADIDVTSPSCRWIFDDTEKFEDSACFISNGGQVLAVF